MKNDIKEFTLKPYLVGFLCLLLCPLLLMGSTSMVDAADGDENNTSVHKSVNGGTMTVTEALKKLKEGNERFQKSEQIHPNLDHARMESLKANGQQPFATILSCSDSRVPVEHIFDQGAGDLFVIRVAGNIAGSSEIGTIEYAVEHLHTPIIVVLGHEDCGAVKASFTDAETSGSLKGLVSKIDAAIDDVKKNKDDFESQDEALHSAIETNLFNTMKELLANSEIIRNAVVANEVELLGAYFNIAEGRVDWLGESK